MKIGGCFVNRFNRCGVFDSKTGRGGNSLYLYNDHLHGAGRGLSFAGSIAARGGAGLVLSTIKAPFPFITVSPWLLYYFILCAILYAQR